MKKPVDNFCKYVLPCGYCENTGALCKLFKDDNSLNKHEHDWELVRVNCSDKGTELEYTCKKCRAVMKESYPR